MADPRGPSRRTRDLAFIVPLLGVILMMPPLVGLFARPGAGIAGVPLIVVYLFGLWLALILAALILARHLGKAEDDGA